MGVRFDQLLSLPELKNLKLVSGNKGIFKIIRWVHIVETPDVIRYVQNGELIILTGVAVYNNIESFVELIKGLIEKKAVGLIVNVGKYFEETPEEIKKLSNENDFPVLELPWEISLTEITRVICSDIVKRHMEKVAYQDLLMNVIFFNKVTYEDFADRVSSHGYDSLNSFRIIIVSFDRFQQYLLSKNIKDEQSITYIKDVFFNAINSTISNSICRPISFLQNDSVVLLLINEKQRFENINMLSQIIRESVKKNLHDISVNIGIGNIYTEFAKIKKSYMEAEKALKAIKAEGNFDETVFYCDIGVYKLLTSIEDIGLLREYYNDTVGKLKQYDIQNNTDFTKIFYTFLKENGSYIQTSQKLYMHRNTLIYKINKIQEIIKRDLGDTKVRFEFYIGYLVEKLNNF